MCSLVPLGYDCIPQLQLDWICVVWALHVLGKTGFPAENFYMFIQLS